MVNVRNVVVDAYKMIGDIGDQEALDGTRTVVGVQLLNELVAVMNLDNMFAFTMRNIDFQPPTSKIDYTIGVPTITYPTVDINADRPSNIIRAYWTWNVSSAPIELYVIAPQDIFKFRSATGTVGTPTYLAYRPDYPLALIQLDVAAQANGKITLVYNKSIPVSNINDILEVPPEYESALKFGLAYVIANRYGKPQEVIATMKGLRDESWSIIKRNTAVRTPLHHMLMDDDIERYNPYILGR